MARPLRIEYENAFYHITSRGNARGIIFRDDFDREMFLNILKDAHDRFNFIVHAFVLMDNHYHFLLETPHANLSASMRHINGVYTQAFNRRHKSVGHLFQGRFKAIVVDHDSYYLELIRYIHLNPWRAGLTKDLDGYRYSSHRALVDEEWAKKWKHWYDRKRILKEFGRSEREAIAHYRNFVNAGKGKESPLKLAIGGYALGDRQFADWLWEEFVEEKKGKGAAFVKELAPRVTFSDVVRAVSKEFGVKDTDVFKSQRGKKGDNVVRGMALHILYRNSGMKQWEIGEEAGGISATAVSASVRHFDKLYATNVTLRKIHDRILKSIR